MSTEHIQFQHQLPQINQNSSTYQCPNCDREILGSNQPIHEAVCGRMNPGGSQRSRNQEPMARPSSSSDLPAPDNRSQLLRQPIIRREERRIAENKMVACPNCEKNVREQELTDHMNFDCSEGDKIPCEFCDKTMPMTSYSQHVESCSMRPQSNQNNRPQSPARNLVGEGSQERPIERQEPQEVEEEEKVEPPRESERQRSSQQRNRSAPRGSSQEGSGTFMGFIQNLAGAALQSYAQNRQKPLFNRGIAGILSKVVGGGRKVDLDLAQQQEPQELEGQRREREEHEQEEQRRMRELFSQLQQPRSNSAESRQDVRGGQTTLVRTFERAPDGSILIRTRRVPTNMAQEMPGMPIGEPNLNILEPLGVMMGMLGRRLQNQQGMPFANLSNMGQPESEGLDKETIDSLATVKYSQAKNRNVDAEAKTCPICLEEFEEGDELRFLWCMHRFHQKCVDSWLDKHTNCPVCKKDFSEAQKDLSA